MPDTTKRSRLINLKTLIVLLAIFVTVVTLINGFYATYQVQKNQLIRQALDTNHAYALKIAAATDNFLLSSEQQLAYSAKLIGKNMNDSAVMTTEAQRLRLQTNSFNTVLVVNKDGIALAASPKAVNLVGKKLASVGVLESLRVQKPLVTSPYIATTGDLVTLISYPIFDESGHYLGYVGGHIYLTGRSILNDLMGQHFYNDGSYIYVVDQAKKIIYHPKPTRIGHKLVGEIATNHVLDQRSGTVKTTNIFNVEMLAGFATIKTSQWGIVAQRPLSVALAPLDNLMKRVVYRMLPLAVFTFLAIWLLAGLISRPLRQLAETAQHMDSLTAHTDLTKIESWYFESKKLKAAMLNGLNLLNSRIVQLKQDAATDPLTGALNRRSLQILLEQLEQQKMTYSVLAIDIDHFKNVNDTFGHAAGDKALIALTKTLYEVSREQDIVARTGGEEFLLVLPNTSIELALKIAERLRVNVSELQIHPIGSMTISIGISACAENTLTVDDVIHQADQALYQAKHFGRNRCEVFVPEA